MIPRGCLVTTNYVPPKQCDKKSKRMPGSSSVTNGSLFKRRNRLNGPSQPESDSVREEGSSVDGSSTTVTTRPSTSKSRRRRDSSISSLSDLRSNLRRRSTSLRAPSSPGTDTVASSRSRDTQTPTSASSRPAYSTSTFATPQAWSASAETPNDPQGYRPSSATSVRPSRGFVAFPSAKRDEPARPSTALLGGYGGMTDAAGQSTQGSGGAALNPTITYQKIHDMASKRISTLDYLRKTFVPHLTKLVQISQPNFFNRHENQVYWCNTLLYTRAALLQLPYFDIHKLSRRACSYLLLGLSISAVLDPEKSTIHDYLRTFAALLADFESYQAAHPPDGPSHSSLSRMRVPGMFKRVPQISNTKNRRGSAADSFSPPSNIEHLDHRSFSGGNVSAGSAASIPSLAGSDRDLLPGEEYQYLLTPSIPFDPDYFETFATLCDALIDCYANVIDRLNSPEACGPGIGDLFAKVDSKVRKILVAGIVRDIEDATKQGVRAELAGVGKVVLAPLM
ncbi:MAG: hypothetical protein M1828_000496 [Chrysothrix sp. TS-e1954]|nr:MAG: hypothetical protein M1828_000496 [Chrysothrix sp. TS-e1954]